MKIHLKQRVLLQKRPYGPGVVDIPDNLAPHEIKHLHRLTKDGLAGEPKEHAVDTLSELERSKKLAEKLLSLKPIPRGPIQGIAHLPPGVSTAEARRLLGETEEASEKASDDESGEEEGEESPPKAEEPEKGKRDKKRGR